VTYSIRLIKVSIPPSNALSNPLRHPVFHPNSSHLRSLFRRRSVRPNPPDILRDHGFNRDIHPSDHYHWWILPHDSDIVRTSYQKTKDRSTSLPNAHSSPNVLLVQLSTKISPSSSTSMRCGQSEFDHC
jgi:hypothetical protein